MAARATISFDADGFGVVGSLGLLYHLDDRTTLGVSYRSPQLVSFAIAREVLPGLVLTAQGRNPPFPGRYALKLGVAGGFAVTHRFATPADI